MTDPKTAARDIAARLNTHDIALKHVQTLDLVAAGCGFQDRGKLSTITELPRMSSVNARLLSTAATALALHDLERRRTIVETTTDVLLGRRAAGADLAPLVEVLTGIKDAMAEDAIASDGVPSLTEWTTRLMDLVAELPKGRYGRPNFAYSDVHVPEWSSAFSEYVRLQGKADEATTTFTALVDATMRVIEAEDGDSLAYDPEENVEGEKPIDYDRVAAILEPVLDRNPPMGALEMAVRDGAGRAAPYIASLSEDPDTAGGAVRAWISEVDEAFRFNAIPSDDRMKELLVAGDYAIHGISHWLPAEDRLWAWMDVASYPDAINNIIEPEESGVAGVYVDLGETGLIGSKPPVFVTATDIARPSEYLASPRGRRILDRLVEDSDFSAWPSDRQTLESDVREGIASRALELMREAKTDEDRRLVGPLAVSSKIGTSDAEDDWFNNGYSAASRIIEALMESDLEQLVDEDAWRYACMEAYERRIVEDDTSTAMGCVSSFDKAEMLFFLHAPDHTIDEMCSIAGPWIEPKSVVIDDQFCFALSRLGITLEEWRAATGNQMEDRTTRPVPAPLERLMTAEKLAQCVENGCTQNFCIVLYGQVPLPDLLKMDISKPFSMTNASVAVYNQYSGTFHDHRLKRTVTFQDGVDGSWQASDVGPSPDSICGLVASCYESRLFDPELAMRAAAATSALDAVLAVEGLKRRMPGAQVSWSFDGNDLSLKADVGVDDADRRYSLREATAVFASPDSSEPEVRLGSA